MLYTILIIVVILIALFAIYIAFQKPEFTVNRTAMMAVDPSKPFEQVNNFYNWEAWSPWAKMDPGAKNTYSGQESGEGASLHWAGNRQVGEGNMTIVESRPSELIKINLDFIKPMSAHNIANFTFTPVGDQTRVTWTMTGERNFICRTFGFFMSMDKMVGTEFEKGLASIKEIVEK